MANRILIKKYKGNSREFAINFPMSWLRETGRVKEIREPMAFSGIINLPGYDEDDDITEKTEKMFFGIMAEYVANAATKNCAPLYCLKITYPKLPSRTNAIRDIRIILVKYQIPDQYVIWIAHNPHGSKDFSHIHMLFSKLKRLANENGKYEIPVFPEQARSESVNARGYSCASNNYLIANLAAIREISELYGYDTDYLQYDKDMRCIGKPVISPHDPRRKKSI